MKHKLFLVQNDYFEEINIHLNDGWSVVNIFPVSPYLGNGTRVSEIQIYAYILLGKKSNE